MESTSPRFEVVIDREEVYIVWDTERGAYWLYNDSRPSVLVNDLPKPDRRMWPNEFKKRFGVFDKREAPYLLYKREGKYTRKVSGETRNYRYHIVHDGEPLCRGPMKIPRPDSDELVPCEQISDEEWRRIRPHKLCSNCYIPDSVRSSIDSIDC